MINDPRLLSIDREIERVRGKMLRAYAEGKDKEGDQYDHELDLLYTLRDSGELYIPQF